MLDNAIIPSCAFIGRHFFRRSDLVRASPAWWWLPARREAWRFFRQRLIALKREIEDNRIDTNACFAEARMFVVGGDRSALNAAIEMTERARMVRMLVGAVGMRATPPTLGRMAVPALPA